eukprot:5644143-Amphidinium_carterae.1
MAVECLRLTGALPHQMEKSTCGPRVFSKVGARSTSTEGEVARVAMDRALRRDRLANMLSAWTERMDLRAQLLDIDALGALEQLSCRPLSRSESTGSCCGETDRSGWRR